MKKLIIPSLLITSSLNSFANVTACRATMHKDANENVHEQTEQAALPDLDALFAQLEESNANSSSRTVAPAQTHQDTVHSEAKENQTTKVAPAPRLADLAPEVLKSMSTLALLNALTSLPKLRLDATLILRPQSKQPSTNCDLLSLKFFISKNQTRRNKSAKIIKSC